MSRLTATLKKVLGPSKTESEGGFGIDGPWGYKCYLLLEETGEYSRGTTELNITYATLIANYDCWKMVRKNTYTNSKTNTSSKYTFTYYIFVVKSKKGDFLGACFIPADIHPTAIVSVGYSDKFTSEEELHEYNRLIDGVISYEKV